MFGMGLQELAVIAFVAVIVFGPDRLPDLARQAGRFVRSMRNFANSARDELRHELGPEFSDLEITDLDPRNIVRKHIIEAMEDEDSDNSANPGNKKPQKNSAQEKTKKQKIEPLGEGPTPFDSDAT